MFGSPDVYRGCNDGFLKRDLPTLGCCAWCNVNKGVLVVPGTRTNSSCATKWCPCGAFKLPPCRSDRRNATPLPASCYISSASPCWWLAEEARSSRTPHRRFHHSSMFMMPTGVNHERLQPSFGVTAATTAAAAAMVAAAEAGKDHAGDPRSTCSRGPPS